jgi:RNA polymerase sigma factor (TIGR02999 family)
MLTHRPEMSNESLVPNPLPAPAGDAAAASVLLFDFAYAELKRLAHFEKLGVRSATLSTTALVHETYLKLARHAESRQLQGEHLKALAARAMRQILIDHVRRRRTEQQHFQAMEFSLSEMPGQASGSVVDLLAVDAALAELDGLHDRLAGIVEMHVFAGMSMPEIAKVLNVTERTVFRDWRKARAFLLQKLAEPA